jgi:hypothetical protein
LAMVAALVRWSFEALARHLVLVGAPPVGCRTYNIESSR